MKRIGTRGARLATLVLALALAGCATQGGPKAVKAPGPKSEQPVADSVTVALWRFDEIGGEHCADSGPYRLDATAGTDTHTDFGRFKSARVFTLQPQSFAIVDPNPVLDTTRGFTIEAWIYLNSTAQYEIQPIAGRWTPNANEQCWVFGVTGNRLVYPAVAQDSPGWFRDMTFGAAPNHVFFGFQPADAAGPKGFYASSPLPLQRWTHVAASFDGEAVRLYVDGRLDGQSLARNQMRPSAAPLEIGCLFDQRRLTSFGGDLRIDPNANLTLFYQFDGSIDELRLSNAVRTHFESTLAR